MVAYGRDWCVEETAEGAVVLRLFFFFSCGPHIAIFLEKAGSH